MSEDMLSARTYADHNLVPVPIRPLPVVLDGSSGPEKGHHNSQLERSLLALTDENHDCERKADSPEICDLRRTTIGSAPTANVATVYASVDGLTGNNQNSPSPPLHILHAVTSSQQKRPECRKILYSRWRKTAFTRGSYSLEEGGMDGAERAKSVDGIARMGVDGVCGGALVDIVVDRGQDASLRTQTGRAQP